MCLFRINFDLFGVKKPRSYERYEKKSDRFGGSKSPKNPISVGEEYIVTIEETSKQKNSMLAPKSMIQYCK